MILKSILYGAAIHLYSMPSVIYICEFCNQHVVKILSTQNFAKIKMILKTLVKTLHMQDDSAQLYPASINFGLGPKNLAFFFSVRVSIQEDLFSHHTTRRHGLEFWLFSIVPIFWMVGWQVCYVQENSPISSYCSWTWIELLLKDVLFNADFITTGTSSTWNCTWIVKKEVALILRNWKV